MAQLRFSAETQDMCGEAEEQGRYWAQRLDIASRIFADPEFDLRCSLAPLGFAIRPPAPPFTLDGEPEAGEPDLEQLPIPIDTVEQESDRRLLLEVLTSWIGDAFSALEQLLQASGRAAIRRRREGLQPDPLEVEPYEHTIGGIPVGVVAFEDVLRLVRAGRFEGTTNAARLFGAAYVQWPPTADLEELHVVLREALTPSAEAVDAANPGEETEAPGTEAEFHWVLNCGDDLRLTLCDQPLTYGNGKSTKHLTARRSKSGDLSRETQLLLDLVTNKEIGYTERHSRSRVRKALEKFPNGPRLTVEDPPQLLGEVSLGPRLKSIYEPESEA